MIKKKLYRMRWKGFQLKKRITDILRDEKGIGVVEVDSGNSSTNEQLKNKCSKPFIFNAFWGFVDVFGNRHTSTYEKGMKEKMISLDFYEEMKKCFQTFFKNFLKKIPWEN